MRKNRRSILSKYIFLLAIFFAQESILYSNNVACFALDTVTPGQSLDYLKGLNFGADYAELTKAQQVLDEAVEMAETFQKIASGNWIGLPIKKTISRRNVIYTIGVGSIKINSGFTEIDVYAKILLPNRKLLFFGAPSIRLNSTGGLVGETKLALLADYAIDLGANKSVLILKRTVNSAFGGTYISFDCDGFKSLGLDAEVVFSRDIVVPVDGNGEQKSGEYVRGNFQTVVGDWNDIIAKISLPDFAITDYTDIAFSLNNAIVDLSDVQNHPQTKFPIQYAGEISPLWRGVYIESLLAILPRQIRKKGQTARTTAYAHNLIIDKSGVSGHLGASNIFSIDEGAMDKWAYSMDTLDAGFVQNQLLQFTMTGDIRPPVMDVKDDSGIEYSASVDGNKNFTFNASLPKAVKFGFLKAAKVSIEKTSIIELTVTKNNFFPRAILNGSMEIKVSLKTDDESSDISSKKGIQLAKIDFEGLEINTIPEYLKISKFSFTSGKLANFPIQLYKVEYRNNGIIGALYADIGLNLVDTKESAFGIRSAIHINCNLEEASGVHQWKFKNIVLDAFALKMDIGPVALDGSLSIFDDDPDYGTGFCGDINAVFKISETKYVNAAAAVIFGRTDEFRYWFADAMVGGLAIPIGVVNITGFGGGASRRMKMASMGETGARCKSVSGVKYLPDGNSGLGIRAMMSFKSPSSSMFTANATFELNFNGTGGVSSANFWGKGEFMVKVNLPNELTELKNRLDKYTKLDKILQQEDAKEVSTEAGKVAFALAINLKFDEDIYHGNFKLYIDVANGKLRGNAGSGSLAGVVDLYASPGRWHFYLGHYDSRLSLLTEIARLQVNAGAYFITGNDLTAPPPLDAKIVSELGIKPDQVSKDRYFYQNDIGTGKGFALGAKLNLIYENQSKRWLVKVTAGAGFEFYCLSFGADKTCANGYGPPIGANGWRARGLIYLYANCAIKYFGIGINPGVGLMVEGSAPNPNHFRAFLRILFIKLQMNIGEECVL